MTMHDETDAETNRERPNAEIYERTYRSNGL